jgi:riboflavin biosynthesis pyrimidine reductase
MMKRHKFHLRGEKTGYLADLRKKSISYLIAGKSEIDFAAALERLHRDFGIRKLMLEGGGGVNGSLLAAGLIDEISLLLCPFADGAPAPTVFDLPKNRIGERATALRFMSAKPRPGGVVWLRYRTVLRSAQN